MIEVKLTGEDALQYLQDKETQEEKYEKLLVEFRGLKDISGKLRLSYIDLQKKHELLLSQVINVENFDKAVEVAKSSRIEHDTELANDIESGTPKLPNGGMGPKLFGPIIKRSPFEIKEAVPTIAQDTKRYGTWTPEDIANIESRLELSTRNKDRTVPVIALSMNRPESTLRTKLNALGFYTKDNVIYKD